MLDPGNSALPASSPIHPYFFLFFFLTFIAIFHPEKRCFPYLEVCTGPWNNTHPSWQPSLHFFSKIFTIFLIFFIQHSHTLHVWKCVLDPEHNAQHGHQPSSIFSQIFSLFYCYFSFSIAALSTLGSMHYTLKTVLNIVTNSEHHLE